MVTALRELFAKSAQPSQEDKESAAHTLASILEQARAIGHAHAAQEEQRGIAWGGKFTDVLGSAWNIVEAFVQRVREWFSRQTEVSEEDVEAEVASLAERVASVEVAAAIESEVLRELTLAGVLLVKSMAQPGACEPCQSKAEEDPVPIDDFDSPPYHGSCRCSTVPAD